MESPPPEPPCSDVWSMLSDNDKEEAWTLLLEWLEHYDIVELLDALSDADWCRGHGRMSRSRDQTITALMGEIQSLLLNRAAQTSRRSFYRHEQPTCRSAYIIHM